MISKLFEKTMRLDETSRNDLAKLLYKNYYLVCQDYHKMINISDFKEYNGITDTPAGIALKRAFSGVIKRNRSMLHDMYADDDLVSGSQLNQSILTGLAEFYREEEADRMLGDAVKDDKYLDAFFHLVGGKTSRSLKEYVDAKFPDGKVELNYKPKDCLSTAAVFDNAYINSVFENGGYNMSNDMFSNFRRNHSISARPRGAHGSDIESLSQDWRTDDERDYSWKLAKKTGVWRTKPFKVARAKAY